MEALTFAYTRQDVPVLFHNWVKKNTPFGSPPAITSLRSVYLPFWVFTATLTGQAGASPVHRAVAGPAMQVYAGAEFPRGWCEVLKNDQPYNLRPFTAAQLDGVGGRVDVAPFAAYEATAWEVARAAQLAEEARTWGVAALTAPRFSGVASRRAYYPAHVVEYTHLGVTFSVLINARTGQAWGLQQASVRGALARAWATVGVGSPGRLAEALARGLGVTGITLDSRSTLAAANVLLAFARPLLRLLFWPPFAASVLFAALGFGVLTHTRSLRQLVAAREEWARTRAAEARQQAEMTDSWQFRPTGRSAREQAEEREAEARAAEAAARAAAGGGARRTQAHPPPPGGESKQRERKAEPPPVDPNDLYAILGCERGATTAEVQAAFRRELMRWHPDHLGDSNVSPEAASERTRLIVAAYGVLRDADKRKIYDQNLSAKRR